MKEVWKNIEGYENLYQISNTGKVLALGNGGRKSRRMIIKDADVKGYKQVTLTKNGKGKHFYVHRLVASAFLLNPNGYKEVNHKDENKTNNIVWINEDGSIDFEKTNLEWCDRTYNVTYGSLNGKYRKIVLQLDLQDNVIKEWESATAIEKTLGFSKGSICGCCNNKPSYHTAYGYKWKWKNNTNDLIV